MAGKLQRDIKKATEIFAREIDRGTETALLSEATASKTSPEGTRRLEDERTTGEGIPTDADTHGSRQQQSAIQTESQTDSFLSPHKTSWNIGEVIEERYEVTELVGKGGMGSVYKIHHREWDIDLAVKVPLANLVEHEILKQRFAIEAQTWVNLGLHPNIVQCWYVREIGGIPCVFMDYLEGGSLKDWMKEGLVGPGEWEAILDIILQACYGLEYAYSKGMIAHRDIKPGNLLLNKNGHLYVTDFGIVKQSRLEEIREEEDIFHSPSGSRDASTLTGSDLGTPEYSAPEQWGKASHADARADMYALGGILFELCCGRRPFEEPHESVPVSVLIGRHLFAPVPDPRVFNEAIPENLATLTMQCLAKEPDERPSTMETLRKRLAEIYKENSGKEYWRELPKPVELRSSALNNRAVSLLDLGQRQEAFTALEEALRLDPHHPESVYNTALLLWRNEKIADDEVIRRLKEAKQASWHAGLYLGLIQLERAEADEAEKELLEVLQFEAATRNGLVWRALGDACMAQEKFNEALTAYKKAMDLLPQDTSVLERIDLAHNRTRQREGQTFFPWPRCLHILGGYDREVTSAALTPGGRFALLGDRETIRFWDLYTGHFLWTFTWLERDLWTYRGFAGSKTSLTLTPDGNFVLSAGSYDPNVRLWDLKTGTCVRTFKGHTQEVRSIAITADGSCLVSAGADSNIRLWKLETGHCLRVFRGHTSPVNTIALSSDGALLLSGSEREIRIWDLETGKYLRRCHGLKDEINALAISPDGKIAISAQRDHTLCLSSINSGRIIQTLNGHSDKVNAVAVTPNGELAVSGSSDRTLRVWDLSTGRCRTVLKGHTGEITSLIVTHDSRTVISASRDKSLREWSLQSGKCIRVSTEFSYWLEALALSPDGKKLLLGNLYEIHIKDRTSGKLLQILPLSSLIKADRQMSSEKAPGKTLPIRTLPPGESFLTVKADTTSLITVSPDGRFAISGDRNETLRLWDLLTKTCLWIYRGAGGLQAFRQHKNWMSTTALALDESILLSNWSDSSLCLWSPKTAALLGKLQGHRQAVSAVALSPDGRFAFSGSFDTEVRRWDLQSQTCLQVYEGHEGTITCLAITSDGKFFLSGSTDHTFRLWDSNTGKCLRTFEGHTDSVTGLAVSPDGRFVLSRSSDKSVRLWRLDAGIPRYHATLQVCRQQDHWALQTLRERFQKLLSRAQAAIRDEKFSTAYTFLALARSVPGYERAPEAMELNASLGKLLRRKTLREGRLLKTLIGHTNTISTVAITTDGRLAISGSRDRDLRIWVISTGVCLRSLQGHRDLVSCVDLSQDKRFAVSGSWDNTLCLWALATGECLKEFTEHEDYVSAVAIAPDGRFAISGGHDKTMRLWSLVTDKHLDVFQGLIAPLEDAYKAAELTTTKCLQVFRGHTAEVSAVAISPDGQFAVSGSWDRSLRIWSLSTGKCQGRFEGHSDAVTAVALSSNGRLLLSASRDRTLRLWSLARQKCLRVFRGHERFISDVTLTSDGRFALSSSWDSTLRLWSVATGKCLHVFERHQDVVEAVALTPEGRFAVSGGRDKTLRVWEFDWMLAPDKS